MSDSHTGSHGRSHGHSRPESEEGLDTSAFKPWGDIQRPSLLASEVTDTQEKRYGRQKLSVSSDTQEKRPGRQSIETEAKCLSHVANSPSDPHRSDGLMQVQIRLKNGGGVGRSGTSED